MFGAPTDADNAFDRRVHKPHRLDLSGESLRRPRQSARKACPPALWTCRFAWTTPRRCPHAHSNRSKEKTDSSRDSRLTTRLDRSQRTSRSERLAPGEIRPERWATSFWRATSNRYTRATSLESTARTMRPPSRVTDGTNQSRDRRQCLDERASHGRAALGHHVELAETRRRVVPVVERPDWDFTPHRRIAESPALAGRRGNFGLDQQAINRGCAGCEHQRSISPVELKPAMPL